MAHEVSEKIIERIKKLLALANNNPNEAEAQSAAAKAQEMLEQHNLDVAAIGHTAQGRPRKDQKQKGGLYGWQRKLWENVAKLNFCHYWSIKGLARGPTYEHRIVGSHANVVSTELMAEYLQGAIEKMAQTWAKEQGYKSVFVREAIAYREGLAERIALRLSQLREQRIAEAKQKAAEEAARAYASSGTALTIVDIMEDEDALNNDYVNGWEPGTTAARRAAQKAREAAWYAEQAEKQRIHEEKLQNDPAYKAEFEEKQARIKEENEKWYESYLKKQARREARGSGRERSRALTPEEQRAQMREFREGYNDGAKIGLDTQVDAAKKGAIR
jgi:hypothetical protein